MEKLSGEFIRGYTKAIQDVIGIFEYIETDMKHHKVHMNHKTARRLLSAILDNREKVRDGFSGFVRVNATSKEFEWFDGEKA